MSSMRSLTEEVFGRLVEDEASERTVDLMLAAMAGEGALAALLETGEVQEKPESGTHWTPPDGAYLTSITVEGFRGVGPRALLTLTPGPGLTVISGRNGSGKSSFAEALECGLTGTTTRWTRKAVSDFGSAWRNLHQGNPCTIEIGLVQANQPPATIRVAWTKDATDPTAAAITYQRKGERRESAAERLGWKAALQTYRPLMSYDDLGRLATSRPSELHDSIVHALALDELKAAIDLLKARAKPLMDPAKRASTERIQLGKDLAQTDDERARTAARLLGKRAPDVVALGHLVTSADAANGMGSIQAQIEAVTLPSAEEVEAAADELDAAQGALTKVGQQRDQVEQARDRLLRDALTLHGDTGDGPCPVCGTGHLDAEWRSKVEELVTATDLLVDARREAEARERAAIETGRRLTRPAPPVLGQSILSLASQGAVVDRWSAWTLPVAPSALSQHHRVIHAGLVDAVHEWQTEARALVDEVVARWQPLALRLAGWLSRYAEAADQADQALELEGAAKAADAVERVLREERLRPIVDRALAVWAQLKQESNVELVDVKLTGASNRRAVDIQAVVDDIGSNALPVMSQGELNSLALALYLPRATSEESPFRFLVLDDPVQAMDPTKVEGLAAVLAELAKTRQVIVFSHDDRLAQAARRLPVVPHLLEVQRQPSSQVVVRATLRPAARYLDDAYALLRESRVEESVKRQVLPGVLRQAAEAAIWERLCRDRLREGARLADLESDWERAERLRSRLELLFGTGLGRWLGQDQRRDHAVRTCNNGSHQPITSDLDSAYIDARALVQAVESRVS